MPPARRPAAINIAEVPATGRFVSYGQDFDFIYSDESSWLAARESQLHQDGPVFMRHSNLVAAVLSEKPKVLPGDRLESSYTFMDYIFCAKEEGGRFHELCMA